MNDPSSLLSLDRLARTYGSGLNPRLREALCRLDEISDDARPAVGTGHSATVIAFPSGGRP